MKVSESDVSIQLRHEIDRDGEYDAFMSITVNVNVRGEKVGEITGTIVNRSRIPEWDFFSAMDGHSSDLQWIGVSIFEPRLGRTKLKSLHEWDSDSFNFLYISKMHIDYAYKENGSSDVGAYALRQILHHPFIKGNPLLDGWTNVMSCVYILNPYEAMAMEEENRVKEERAAEWHSRNLPETEESLHAKEEKNARMDTLAREDANQFLRNGFFQDAAVACLGGNSRRILVASHGQWSQPLKPQLAVADITFYAAPPSPRPPTGKDSEIFQITKKMCTRDGGEAVSNSHIAAYRSKISKIIAEGGSLARSNALHAASSFNDFAIARCIIQMDPTTVDARDNHNATPLMIAASSAAGRSNIDGMPRDQQIIDFLLASGAQKGLLSNNGMTAHDILVSTLEDAGHAENAMIGRAAAPRGNHDMIAGLAQLQAKLRVMVILGATVESGFIDFSEEAGDMVNFIDDDDEGDY